MFEDFDFGLLDTPEFKEDSVREEIILPILRRLGYSASPPNQICRSVKLQHPYVYIGSKKQNISIFPDYMIKRNDTNFFVLDAKAPSENVIQGKNVEQAYSYAIHKEVRTQLFALCNGREFALYHVSHWPALLNFFVPEIENHWRELAAHIGSEVVRRDATFLPDLGIGMLRLGLAHANKKKVVHLHVSLDIHLVARVDEENYSLQSYLEFDGTAFLGTFDFSKALLPDFLEKVEPKECRVVIEAALKGLPFIWKSAPSHFAFVGLACTVGDFVQSNEDEQYLPFVVEEFI